MYYFDKRGNKNNMISNNIISSRPENNKKKEKGIMKYKHTIKYQQRDFQENNKNERNK